MARLAPIRLPVTEMLAVLVSDPLVAVKVMMRFERSAPMATVAVTLPSVPVVELLAVTRALASTATPTVAPDTTTRLLSTAVTVAVTTSLPELVTLCVSRVRMRSATTAVPPLPVQSPKPQSPELPPPPPQPATSKASAAPTKPRNLRIISTLPMF